MTNTNIINEFWEHIEDKKETSKTAQKVYNWLNKDYLASIIEDRGVFWTEMTNSYNAMPSYVYEYIYKWATKRGLQSLYDLD